MTVSDDFAACRARIDARLASIAETIPAPRPLADPLRHALTLRGKRVRGALVMFAAEAAGGDGDGVADAAAAIEMIHSSSLILDDLPSMDDASLRRGDVALHLRFGEDLAVLTAVALLNHAYGLIAENHARLAPRQWPLAVLLQRVVNAVGWDGSIAGEAVDLHPDEAFPSSAADGAAGQTAGNRFETLEFIHSRKTGALFVASAATGCMLANGHPGPLQRLEVFARNLGLAFQITDDILDVTATSESLGKDAGRDEGRLTFVKLAGVDGARQLCGELVTTSIEALAPLGAAAEPLRRLALMVRDRTS